MRKEEAKTDCDWGTEMTGKNGTATIRDGDAISRAGLVAG